MGTGWAAPWPGLDLLCALLPVVPFLACAGAHKSTASPGFNSLKTAPPALTLVQHRVHTPHSDHSTRERTLTLTFAPLASSLVSRAEGESAVLLSRSFLRWRSLRLRLPVYGQPAFLVGYKPTLTPVVSARQPLPSLPVTAERRRITEGGVSAFQSL